MALFQELVNVYKKYWLKEEYVIMPYTDMAKTYLKKIEGELPITGILDNNKNISGSNHNGIPIMHPSECIKDGKKPKIIISYYYESISKQLENMGYKENIDYMDMRIFVPLWYWVERKQVILPHAHTAITTYCSLNCENCNMFINHYTSDKKHHSSLKEFQDDYNAFFKFVDYCYEITILGGEPFLNRELVEMIRWLYKSYGDRIGKLSIVTNGTIIPTEDILNGIKETATIIRISDYGINESYKKKLLELEELLTSKNISYEINSNLIWKDFYFPKKKQGALYDDVSQHMKCCNPTWRGVNDKKFYYCHIVWSAHQAGLWEVKEQDYVDLSDIKDERGKEKVLAHDLGYIGNRAVSLCNVCGGCGEDNSCIVKTGIQS